MYAALFGCNLDEAEISDPEGYPTLGAFFRRKLKNTARPIDSDVPLTSPCDGRVLACGLVDPATGCLEQVGSLSTTILRADIFLNLIFVIDSH